jgi:hypothetical protein
VSLICRTLQRGLAIAVLSLLCAPEDGRASTPLHPDASFVGEADWDNAGAGVAVLLDANGDGYGDIVIGAPGSDEGAAEAGQIYLLLGSPYPWSLGTDLGGADASFHGEGFGDSVGTSIADAGDVDGDGLSDLLIGAPYAANVPANEGRTYLVLGRTGGWSPDESLSLANASFVGEGGQDLSGSVVAGAGDVDGDGFDELLVASPSNDEAAADAGQVYLIRGAPTGWAPQTALASADASFLGEAEEDGAGRAIAGAGDMDGDGLHDILIAAIANDEGGESAGKVYLVLGASVPWATDVPLSSADATFLGDDAWDQAGLGLDGGGDVDGDGLDDLVVGAQGSDLAGPDAGQTYLVLGRMDAGWGTDVALATADASFLGEASGHESGDGVACAGDVDGDGLADLVVGAPTIDDTGINSGRAYVLLGTDTGWLPGASLGTADGIAVGQHSGARVGSALAGGDVDGDGLADLILGAYGSDDNGAESGTVYLVVGRPSGDHDGDGVDAWDGDCDDGDPAVLPGAIEVANAIDDDCDGTVDEGTAGHDDDGDGYSEWEGDCDDTDVLLHPGAPEYCDGRDSDCDGELLAYDIDGDGDGFLGCEECDDADPSVFPGAPDDCSDGIDADCAADLELTEIDNDGDGFAECSGDCDDDEIAVHPDAPEVCNGIDDDCDPATDEDADGDGDGVSICGGDCDDQDALAFPGAVETCDGTDEDCNGVLDDLDEDHDGFGACDPPPTGDCDDTDGEVNPAADEVAYNGVDDDCDGADLTDIDGDGFDGAGGPDCDDLQAEVHPGAEDIPYNGIDEDCDDGDLTDADGDGAPSIPWGLDCDDADPATGPHAPEQCDNGADDDCDGAVDASDPDCVGGGVGCHLAPELLSLDAPPSRCTGVIALLAVGIAWIRRRAWPLLLASLAILVLPTSARAETEIEVLLIWDIENERTDALEEALDSYGFVVTRSHTNETSFDGTNPDPVDFDAVVHLNARTHETGMAEQGQLAILDWVNTGGAYVGSEWNAYEVWAGQMLSMQDLVLFERDGGTMPSVHLSAVPGFESHAVLLGVPGTFSLDAYANHGPAVDFMADPVTVLMTDQYGSAAVAVREFGAGRVVGFHVAAGYHDSEALMDPHVQQLYASGILWATDTDLDSDGWLRSLGDCNDHDPTVYPAAPEVCDDGIDQNCDEADVEWTDGDGDGFSNCTGDCDDSDPSRFPGATEICDLFDSDCDGQVDEGFDLDGDGWSVCDTPPDCDDSDPSLTPADDDGDGSTPCSGDCDDSDATAHPGAIELCDGVDNDCDGVVAAYEEDADADGFLSCEECDDDEPTIHPGATEDCADGIDSDCNGDLEDTEVDDDEDGFAECDGDCDDADGAIHPDGIEECNGGIDDDCDPLTDEYQDADGRLLACGGSSRGHFLMT